MSGADTCRHIERAITHSQLVGIDGFVKLTGLLVDLSKGEADISIVGIRLCRLVILADNRFVFSLTLAAQVPANAGKSLERGGARGPYRSNLGDMQTYQGRDIARVHLQHSLVLRHSLLASSQLLQGKGIVQARGHAGRALLQGLLKFGQGAIHVA